MGTRLNGPAVRVVKLLLFALVVHLFVIPQIGGARKALSVLGSVNPALVVAAVLLEGLSFLAYARIPSCSCPGRPGLVSGSCSVP